MQTILVTGSRGFIGSHLVKALAAGTDRTIVGVSRSWCWSVREYPERNVEHTEVGYDLADEDSVRRLMEVTAPDVIYHMAGNPNVRLAPDDPQGSKMWRTNVDGTRFLLAHAPEGCRFVFASSATVYGDQALRNGWVQACDESYPTRPTNLYGASKLAGETLVSTYTRMGRVRGVSLRYVANVGPHSTHGVVHDVLAKLRSDSPTLDLLGDWPGSVKPYMHVADTVAATLLVGETDCTTTTNVSTCDTLSVEELADVVMYAAGILKPVRWLGAAANWKGDNPRVEVSNHYLHSFRFVPQCPTSADAVARAVKEMLQLCPKAA